MWSDTQTLGDEPVVFNKCNIDFLQNMQDARSNSLHYKMSGDPLAKITVPYEPANPQDGDDSDTEDEEEEPEIEETAHELFARQLEAEYPSNPSTDNNPDFLHEASRNFKFDKMKDKGKDNCGYDHRIEVETVVNDVMDFVET